MRKRDVFLAIVILGITSVSSINAQTLSEFRNKLEYTKASDPTSNAQVTIREDDSARIALTELESRDRVSSVEGYRIGIFFDNGATARAGAMEVVKQCEKLFPDIPTTMNYDNPYFKVSAGYCIDNEEAIMMLNRIQKHFPKAYLMREQITTEDLKAARDQERANARPTAGIDYVEVEEL
ncbi:MAG: hypothetical protein R3Y39_04295 [Rikenellaceae bacterium]